MGRKSIIIYDSWGTLFNALPAEQAGKLVKAICAYGFSGSEPEIDDPAVNAMFLMIREKMDEDAETYQRKVANLNNNISKSSRNRTEIDTKSDTKSERNQNENGGISVSVSVSNKDNNIPPKSPTNEEAVNGSDLSEPLKAKILEWLAYKRERRETYKPTGLKSLLTEIKRYEGTHGTDAVINLINESMANGWRGIIWDRLDKAQPRAKPGQVVRTFEQRAYDFSTLEKQLVKNA